MMNRMSDVSAVKRQYANADNLNIRISIHDKYSVNKLGFGNWIVSNYRIDQGAEVLEIGCGTGDMWKNGQALIGGCSKLILSDFSEGMVEAAKDNVGHYDNVEYRTLDIQEIPYEDGTFDVVIANMMLYHVPDINRGLSEVKRVLKKSGRFYCATYGENGIMKYLAGILSEYGAQDCTNNSFTLQNGYEILREFFPAVEKLEYEDALAVTDMDDMAEYVYSLSGMASLGGVPKAELMEVLKKHAADGVLHVPKEYGMFIASQEMAD